MKISKTFKTVGANKDEAFENLLFDIYEFIRRENSDDCEIEVELDDTCEQCKKLGENTCGNDMDCRCFEPKN